MAKKDKKSSFTKKVGIKDTEGGGFGTYDETNGGGTPRGGIWGGKNGRIGWQERIDSGDTPSSAHRKKQPRTKDGKWTYNSVNGGTTKYESRGETVNPLLTGGENGVYIKDAAKQFAEKKGWIWEKYGKTGEWHVRGSEKVVKEGGKHKIKLANEDIWEIARRRFDIEKGEFEGESENWSETKKGRHSTEEEEAIREAKKTKGETYVKDEEGGIKTHGKFAGGSPEERADRTKRIVDYLKGKYGLAPEAMEPIDHKEGDLEGAAKTAEDTYASRVVERSKRAKEAAEAARAARAAEPREEKIKTEEEVEEIEPADTGKIYTHEKSNKRELKAGKKYSAEQVKNFKDQFDAHPSVSDEDRAYVEEVLSGDDQDAIDELLDQLSPIFKI